MFIPLQGFAQPGYGRRDTITVRGCGIDNCADTVFVLSDTLKAAPSIRTNLFYCASASANLGFEFPLGEHFSIGANLGLKSWPRWLLWDTNNENPVKWRHILIVPSCAGAQPCLRLLQEIHQERGCRHHPADSACGGAGTFRA